MKPFLSHRHNPFSVRQISKKTIDCIQRPLPPPRALVKLLSYVDSHVSARFGNVLCDGGCSSESSLIVLHLDRWEGLFTSDLFREASSVAFDKSIDLCCQNQHWRLKEQGKPLGSHSVCLRRKRVNSWALSICRNRFLFANYTPQLLSVS